MDFSYYVKIGDIDMVRQMIGNVDVNQQGGYGVPLIEASRKGHLEIVKLLIQHGANVNVVEGMYTPLHVASVYGNLEIVKELLNNERGVEININWKDNLGITALHEASVRCHFDIIKYLIKNGADINFLDNNRYSPLYMALFYKTLRGISADVKIDCIKLLLDLGADPYITYNKEQMVKELRSRQHNRESTFEQTIIDLFESYDVPIKEPYED